MKLTTGFKLGSKTYKTITRTTPLIERSIEEYEEYEKNDFIDCDFLEE